MVREATPADLKDLAALFDSYRMFHGAKSSIEGCNTFLASSLDDADSKIFLASLEGHSIGFALLRARYAALKLMRTWLLADLFVVARCRRQGFARELVLHALAFAEESGSDVLHVTTDERNGAALALYRSLGFEIAGGTVILSARFKPLE
ncbi:MAG: GNAT family N-acetyltransferase [Fimbriimonadaceae bacterium]